MHQIISIQVKTASLPYGSFNAAQATEQEYLKA